MIKSWSKFRRKIKIKLLLLYYFFVVNYNSAFVFSVVFRNRISMSDPNWQLAFVYADCKLTSARQSESDNAHRLKTFAKLF